MSEAVAQLQGSIADGNLRIEVAALTDVGRERSVNEDAYHLADDLTLFLVCDGMGGHTNGRLASTMAIDSIVSSMQTPKGGGGEPLRAAMEAANEAIYSHADANPDCRGMGTTAVGIRLENDRVQICHVGDSRVYRLRGPALQQLTRDHSLTNLYADQPELDGRLGPATSNVIVRAIGLEPRVQVDHRDVAMEEDDLFLLCCDGLTDLVGDDQVTKILLSDAPLPVKAKELVAAANENGGTDNITVILVAVEGRAEVPLESKTTLGF